VVVAIISTLSAAMVGKAIVRVNTSIKPSFARHLFLFCIVSTF
jgi:hypothetical protein